MKNLKSGAVWKLLSENRYVLLVLVVGLLLLLLPKGSGTREILSHAVPATAAPGGVGAPLEASGIPLDAESERLAALLRGIRGVGEDAAVLLSRSGAVVVCAGAEDPRVRLEVTEAVTAYTGLGSDRIQIFKSSGGTTTWQQ